MHSHCCMYIVNKLYFYPREAWKVCYGVYALLWMMTKIHSVLLCGLCVCTIRPIHDMGRIFFVSATTQGLNLRVYTLPVILICLSVTFCVGIPVYNIINDIYFFDRITHTILYPRVHERCPKCFFHIIELHHVAHQKSLGRLLVTRQ